MEIVAATDSERPHRWLKWVGLRQPPVDPDGWVPIVRGLPVADPETGQSTVADRLISLLAKAGIEAEQRTYLYDTTTFNLYGLPRGEEVHAAVLVHERDRRRGAELATELNDTLDRERPSDQGSPQVVSDAELTRQALAAGQPPEE